MFIYIFVRKQNKKNIKENKLKLPYLNKCESHQQCIDMLKNDECDGTVASSIWLSYVLKTECELELVSDTMRPEFSAWIFKADNNKNRRELNKALIWFRSEGTIDELWRKYIDIPHKKNKHCIIDKHSKNTSLSLKDSLEGDNLTQIDILDVTILWYIMISGWIVCLTWKCITG